MERLREVVDAGSEDHGVNTDYERQPPLEWVYDALDVVDGLQWLVDADPGLKVAKAIYGPAVRMDDVVLRTSYPGRLPQPWHRDLGQVPFPMPRVWMARPSITVLWYLDDTTESGGFQFVPRSHLEHEASLRGSGPLYPYDRYTSIRYSVTVYPDAGDALLFASGLLHRGLANGSTHRRRLIGVDWAPDWAGRTADALELHPGRARPAPYYPSR